MQNVSQRCKIKVAKFHFIILWRFGVIQGKPQEGGGGGGRILPTVSLGSTTFLHMLSGMVPSSLLKLFETIYRKELHFLPDLQQDPDTANRVQSKS